MFPFTKIYTTCERKLKEIILDKERQDERVLHISTYQSSNKEKYGYLNTHYNCIIYDEVHYTVLLNKNDQSSFQYILKNGKSDKTFFFTATTKIVKIKPKISTKSLDDIIDGEDEFLDEDNEEDNRENIISMDNEKVYGKTLMHMRLDEAIEQKYLTDYNITLWLYKGLNKESNMGLNKLNCISNILKETCGKKYLYTVSIPRL